MWNSKTNGITGNKNLPYYSIFKFGTLDNRTQLLKHPKWLTVKKARKLAARTD